MYFLVLCTCHVARTSRDFRSLATKVKVHQFLLPVLQMAKHNLLNIIVLKQQWFIAVFYQRILLEKTNELCIVWALGHCFCTIVGKKLVFIKKLEFWGTNFWISQCKFTTYMGNNLAIISIFFATFCLAQPKQVNTGSKIIFGSSNIHLDRVLANKIFLISFIDFWDISRLRCKSD